MKFKSILILAVVALLTACGGGIEGSYGNKQLGTVITFNSNGKALYLGASEMDYEMNGKEIKLHVPRKQAFILKVQEDGSINFPLLGNLTKVAS